MKALVEMTRSSCPTNGFELLLSANIQVIFHFPQHKYKSLLEKLVIFLLLTPG